VAARQDDDDPDDPDASASSQLSIDDFMKIGVAPILWTGLTPP
jgi:hypothetical protein